ncbi:hypothetical protein GF389_03765 [Candidatus Dojkabacteria bacterium]|nr:hypothetical protein [Candidatus Dojkabacteria bacterium]
MKMQNIEAFRLTNPRELNTCANEYTYIKDNYRLCPGLHMNEVLGEPIDGVFGIQLMDLKGDNETPVAAMGFEINGSTMFISQTPTGEYPGNLSARQSRYVGFSNFRENMLQVAIDLARDLKLDSIHGHSVKSHPNIEQKIQSKQLTAEQAKRILDQVYDNAGFSRRWDDKYILVLN